MSKRAASAGDREPERPIPETYWVVPGRLLVGEYPGALSRAAAMDRVRRFVEAGVTCFVDLTELAELPSYEPLLPLEAPDGRRIEYLREPIPDHGVPATREDMSQALSTLDSALEAGHVVYLHCRAGIGRSATVAGCWLASRPEYAGEPLRELQRRWRTCATSAAWPSVPETEEQAAYVRDWAAGAKTGSRPPRAALGRAERVRGALLGLAAGDVAGSEYARGRAAGGRWTQHTALALCLAESLLECHGFDARDQIERYLRWQREGHLSATGRPPRVTPDVARALATYQWRHQPMAGSHDPQDRSTASLPRVVTAVAYAAGDPAEAVHLAGECSRTTHQSPFVIDACRCFGALLVGAVSGATPDALGNGLYEPVPGLWATRPLKPSVAAALRNEKAGAGPGTPAPAAVADAVQAVVRARAAAVAGGFDEAVRSACDGAAEPGLTAALAGALHGAMFGASAIPRDRLSRLARLDVLEDFARRLAARPSAAGGR